MTETHRRSHRIGWSISAALVVLSAVRTGSAESPPPEEFGDRTLKGHTFQLPAYFPSAFVLTYLGLRTTARFVSIHNAPTIAGDLNLNTTGAAVSLDFGVKFNDIVALDVTAGVRAIVGTNLPALVYAGATYDHGLGVRVPVRILRIESSGTQLSLAPYFSFTSGQVATLLPLFINRPAATLATTLEGNTSELLAIPIKTTTFGLHVPFAQALSPIFGLQALAGFGRDVVNIKTFDTVQNQRVSNSVGGWNFDFAVAFGADGNPVGLPVAGLVEYTVSRQPAATSLIVNPDTQSVHTIAGGVYYSGRRDLQAGIIASWQVRLNPLQTDRGFSDRPSSTDLGVIIRYYW
jgi:hypothetical protein